MNNLTGIVHFRDAKEGSGCMQDWNFCPCQNRRHDGGFLQRATLLKYDSKLQ